MMNRYTVGQIVPVLDKGHVHLQDVMGTDLSIVNAARVSFLGESKGEEKDKKLLFYLMRNEHWSPFEMVEYKFRIKAPLFVARQWMRHRTWNYNEVSRRYTSEELEFYVPDEWRKQSSSNKQASDGALEDVETIKVMYSHYVNEGLDLYNYLVSEGVAREQARMVLPQSMYTTFIAKADLRNLLHFVRLRLDPHAQYEIRVYAKEILNFIHANNPWTYEAFMTYVMKKEVEEYG